MSIIDGSDAPVFDIPAGRFVGLVSPQRGSSENSVWRVRLAPRTEPLFHQMTREQIFVVLSGAAQLHIGGSVRNLTEGSAAVVPPRTDFALSNPGETAFEALVILPVGGLAVLPGEEPFTPPWAA